MTRTRHEKINKYSDLAVEIKTMWNLNSVRIVPIIISSVGLIPKTLRGDLASLHLKPELIMQMQKAVIIDTCHTKILLYSLQHDEPSFTGDGFVSQGLIYAAFSVCLWLAPSVNSVVGPKITMVMGVVGYEIFILSFFFHITWLIYLGSILVGVGAALVWTGQGSYLILNSHQETLERNLGLFQILFTSGSISGNLFIYFAFLGKKYIDESTRQTVIIFLTIILNVGGALLLLLPKPDKGEVDNHLKAKSTEDGRTCEPITDREEFALTQNTEGAWQTFKKAWSIACTRKFLVLCFMFCNIGLSLAFTVIYNSCLGFTNNIPNAKEWVPLGGFISGLGGIVGGILPIVLNTEAHMPFRIRPLMLIGFIGYTISYIIAFLNFPDESIFGDTDNVAYMMGNPYLCLFGTMMLHMGETLYNTETQTLLAKIFPNDAVPAFAIAFCVKNIFTSVAFNISNIYGLHLQLIALTVMCILGLISFAHVSIQVNNKDEKIVKKTQDEMGGRDNPCLVERS
ncbi:hypothetical protein M8J75_014224 [Diaphorina citri]|nr:hypothetical protein M8J75_014224 [Diaphorina citri]